MVIAGTYSFTAPPAAVWDLLLDPAALAQALPDCRRLDSLGAHTYHGTLLVHAGLVQGEFNGTVKLRNVRPGQGYDLQADGHSAQGRLSGRGSLWLEPVASQTVLHYQGEIAADGAIAEVGERYLETAARAIVRQNLAAIDRRLRGAPAVPAVDPPAARPPVAPSIAGIVAGALLGAGLLGLLAVRLARALYRRWVARLARQVAAELQD